MSKKKGKKKKKNKVYDLRQYENFASYARNRNEKQMDKIQDDLDDLIWDIKKADRKYEKLKKKVKAGKKSKADLKEYRKNHVVHSRRRAAEFLKSADFIKIVGSMLVSALALAKVIAQMVSSLIVLILSCKKIRESLPVKVIEGMQSTYDFCHNLA